MLGVGTGEGERWASKLKVKSEKCFETRQSRGKGNPIIIGFSLLNFRAMVAKL